MIAVGHTGCRRSIGQHADGMFRPYRAEDRRGPLAQGGAPPKSGLALGWHCFAPLGLGVPNIIKQCS
jgi:hypothetical protein